MSREAVAALSANDVEAILDRVVPEISHVFKAANVDGQVLSVCSTDADLSPKICGLWNALKAPDASPITESSASFAPESLNPPPPPPPLLPPPAPPPECEAMGGTTTVSDGTEQCMFETPATRKAPEAIWEATGEVKTASIRRAILEALGNAWEAAAVKPEERAHWEATWLLRQGISDHGFCLLLQDKTECNYEALTSAILCYSEATSRASLPHANSLSGLARFQLLHDGANPSLATVQSVTEDLQAALEKEPNDWLTLMLLGMHYRYHILVEAGVFGPASDPAVHNAGSDQIMGVADAQKVLLRAGEAMVADLLEANLDCFSYPHAQIWPNLQSGQGALIQALLDTTSWLHESKSGASGIPRERIFELAESMHVWTVDGETASAKQLENMVFLGKTERERLVLATPQ
eukprot:COSAG02_NODE_1446_length_12578_cov_3.488661_8_plen_408_part_00